MSHHNKAIQAITIQQLSQRFDANETALLARQLEFVRAEVYKVKYSDLIARRFLPVATDIPETANSYTYFVKDTVGKAKIVANATDDLPRIDSSATERDGKVRRIGASYGWDLDELAEAARVGVDLSSQKAQDVREAIERAVDEVLFNGTTTHPSQVGADFGITGIANNADVVSQGIINPAGDPWSTTPTAAEMLTDLNTMVNTIVNANSQAFLPDTILFAPSEYSLLASTPYGVDADSTVLTWFLKNNPYIKQIDQWYRLTGAGAGGTTNRAIIYKRDKSILEAVIPMDFRQEAPQARNLEFIVPCRARCGGVKVYQPAGVRYADFQP